MVSTKSKMIGGVEYSLTQLPAMRAHRLLPSIMSAMGGAVSRIASGQSTADVGAIGAAVAALGSGMSADAYEHLLKELLYSLRSGTKEVGPHTSAFDDFAGKPFTVVQLVWFALELNYQDFFDALRGGNRPQGPALSVSTSPST